MTSPRNIAILVLAAFAVLAVVSTFIDSRPKWDFAIATRQPKATLEWRHRAPVIANGLIVGSDQAASGGCVSLNNFEHQSDQLTIFLSVSRFNSPSVSQKYYSKMLDLHALNGPPICSHGSSDGYSFAITKSRRPRNDPAGGGFFQNRRTTYMTVSRHTTVATVEVHSNPARRRVDMNRIFSAVDQIVDTW